MKSAGPRNFKAAVETSNRLLGDAANGQLGMFEQVTRKGMLRDLAQQYVKRADGKPFKVESLETALERRRKFDETKISMQKKRDGKRISRAERLLRTVLEKAIDRKGVLGDWREGQRILESSKNETRLQKRIDAIKKAENFIEESLKGKHRNKSVTIDLPLYTRRKVKSVMGRDYDSHNIDANGMVHAKKNHGVGGKKIDEKSIPLRDDDFKLAPYIMIAPDKVERGSMGADGRESIRFIKRLSNGVVLVVEKEQKNSPDDMDTINMWANKSSRVADARFSERPLHSTSKPANNTQGANSLESNTVTVITSFDAAKIRKDAETAIKKDEKNNTDGNIKFFRTSDGEAYGFAYQGKIYIDPEIAGADTPIHEYAHLWGESIRQRDAKLWSDIVNQMKTLTDVWERVKEDYPELKTDDEIAEEVLANYSGEKGREKLMEVIGEMDDADPLLTARVIDGVDYVRRTISSVWRKISDFFGWGTRNPERIADTYPDGWLLPEIHQRQQESKSG